MTAPKTARRSGLPPVPAPLSASRRRTDRNGTPVIAKLAIAAGFFLLGAAAMGQTPAWVHASLTIHYASLGLLIAVSIAAAAILGPRRRQPQQQRPRAGRPW